VRIGSKITKSDSNSYYEITGLQINRTYKVVANHFFYIRTVKKVTLTAEKSEKNLIIYMESIIDYIFDILMQIIKFIPQGINVDKS
jgi:L-cystine uptake protein TcyP (sodium:dicarboxylate symporter family)